MSNDLDMSVLSNIHRTKNIILRAFAGIYLVAFLSFYIQCDGECAAAAAIKLQAKLISKLHNFQVCLAMRMVCSQRLLSRLEENSFRINFYRLSNNRAG